jgi:hypothetical protein
LAKTRNTITRKKIIINNRQKIISVNQIEIQINAFYFHAELYDTPTANKIYHILPLHGNAILWGNEIYFPISSHISLESNARVILNEGKLGYCPDDNAFCIFFGQTPVSSGSKTQAYSHVNAFGKLIGDYSLLKKVRTGDLIKVIRHTE